jgi:hypothetical protein
MEYNLFFVTLLFIATCVIAVLGFYAASKSKTFLIFSIFWILIQSILGFSGFYRNINLVPPRIMLFGLLPILLIFASTFLSIRGKNFVDSIDLKLITYCHTIRLPIEIILTLLYHKGLMSVLVTFEGTNFDVLSGISAPIIAFFVFRKKTVHHRILLLWNFICLILLLNVIVTAVLSTPSPMQLLSLAQPNVAILTFPFNLLPSFIAPLMLYSHLIAIRKILIKKF